MTGLPRLVWFIARQQPARSYDALRVASRICHEAENREYNREPNQPKSHPSDRITRFRPNH